MSWTVQDEQEKISNAEVEYMEQWAKAIRERGQLARDMTVRNQRIIEITKYSPCYCGSGKKFKFCCYKK